MAETPYRAAVEVRWRRALAAAAVLVGLFILVFVLLVPGGGGASDVAPARLLGDEGGAHVGDTARDFEARGLDGEPVRLSDLRGRPVVVNFWASWCGSCASEMPALEEQRRRHEGDGLVVLAVNVGEGLDDARAFIERFGLEAFAVAMDPDLSVSDAFGIRGLPHSLFIDAGGTIQAEFPGHMDDETMARYIRAAIDGAPGGEPPAQLRFVTTVPREHVLVVAEEQQENVAVFFSRRFRCAADYCSEGLLVTLRSARGVLRAEIDASAREPALAVVFDPSMTTRDDVVAFVADALRAYPDPLYTQPLELRVQPEAS